MKCKKRLHHSEEVEFIALVDEPNLPNRECRVREFRAKSFQAGIGDKIRDRTLISFHFLGKIASQLRKRKEKGLGEKRVQL